MKIVKCDQGSEQWLVARRGIPTASEFHNIVTPAKLEPSKAADKYLARCLVETFFPPPPGVEGDAPTSGLMHRGTVMEDEARRTYAFEFDGDVQTVGFCLRDDGRAGASPDALIDDDGLLEIKCKGAEAHMLALLDNGAGALADHRLQVQGELWVTGRAWAALYLFHPDLPTIRHVVRPDPAVLAAFDEHIPAFCDRLDAAKARLLDLGCLLPGQEAAAEPLVSFCW